MLAISNLDLRDDNAALYREMHYEATFWLILLKIAPVTLKVFDA